MDNVRKNDELESKPIGKLFVKLSIPAVLAQIVNLLYNIIDRMFIGHIPEVGSAALTGVGVTFPIIMIISAFSCLCGMGGAPKASIAMGEKNLDKANKILGNCVSLTIILSIILTIVIEIFNRELLMLFGASDNTIDYAVNYIKIYSIGTIFVMISLGLNMFITTQGFSKISMINVIVGALLNIILDPIFIYFFNMGVQGAALATIISQAVSSILVLRFLLSKKSILKISINNLKIDIKIIFSCVALGIAPFIMQATESILSICFNTSLSKYEGDIAVGTMTILASLMQFAMLPLQGFTQGAQPIISYNYGAKKYDRCNKAFKVLLITCLSYSMLYYLLIMIFPQIFVKIFTNEETLISYAVWALRIYMAVIGIFGIQIACQQTFIALGNAKMSLFLAILRKIILLIPLIYIVPLFTPNNKCLGVFLAEPIADTLAVLTTAICFVIVFRKTLKTNESAKLFNK